MLIRTSIGADRNWCVGYKRRKPMYLMHRFQKDGKKAVEIVGQAPSYKEATELARHLAGVLPGPIRCKEIATNHWAKDAVVLLGPCC